MKKQQTVVVKKSNLINNLRAGLFMADNNQDAKMAAKKFMDKRMQENSQKKEALNSMVS